MSNFETWIVYKAETMSASGWEERKLLPEGAITDILCEEWDSSGQLPSVGSRIREYVAIEDPECGGITHSRESDWVVTRIQQFSSFDTEERILVCYCSYQPIKANWEKIQRGVPVAEMLETAI
jgi:hypothetical protein